VSEANVQQLPILIGHHNADNTSAEIRKTDFHTLLIGQRIEVGGHACMLGLKMTAQQSALSGLLTRSTS
jgi:hypothetical protein